MIKYLYLAMVMGCSLLPLSQANPYWRSKEYKSKFEKEISERKFERRDNQSERLYVHLIAHTHDDVGWKKTVDEYYDGVRQNVQLGSVGMTITTVVESLLKDKQRKFTYVEMKFFSMWWQEQEEKTKQQVRQLVKEGRLEFVNAGWSMHDEACPHFEDMINNMMYGHRFLLKEFGVKPRVGWHIDPFGHSNANARLFADMGLEAWFFARLDHTDKDERLQNKSMNFLWRPFSTHFGKQKQIFTGSMRDHYCWPEFFWVDENIFKDEPIVTDKSRSTFNADLRVQQYQTHLNHLSKQYQGQHLLEPFGCDFSFANAEINFEQMDRLISYFNEHNTANITLLYSTPGNFIDAVHSQNLTWPVKYDDMFPYSDNPEDFWSGYFSSRQAGKKQVRDGQANLLAANYLYSLMALQTDIPHFKVDAILSASNQMFDAMGVYQHHDAISGTAKQRVADDYVHLLSKAMHLNNQVYGKILQIKATNELDLILNRQFTLLNGAQNDTVQDTPMGSDLKNESKVLVVVHNPSATLRDNFVKIQVPSNNYTVKVFCPETKKYYDVTNKSSFLRQHHHLKDGKMTLDYLLYVPFKLLPNQIGYLILEKDGKQNDAVDQSSVIDEVSTVQNATLEYLGVFNQTPRFNFTKVYHLEASNSTITKTLSQQFSVSLGYYAASDGTDNYTSGSNSAEGAYLLKPKKGQEWQFRYAAGSVELLEREVGGAVGLQQYTFLMKSKDQEEVALVRVVYCEKDPELVQFDVELNGIKIDDGVGKDVTVNWDFHHFDDGNLFWTDSNGLEMQKRVKDERFSFTLDKSGNQNVSWNYYPINSAIAMRKQKSESVSHKLFSDDVQVTVMNERSQGGAASITKGRIELIQNRRLLHDDDRGVEECLNETDKDGYGLKVNARYWLNIFDTELGSSAQRTLQNHIDRPYSLFFYTIENNQTDVENMRDPDTQPLNMLDSVSDWETWQQFGRLVMFPIKKNIVLIRLQNSADLFDSNAKTLKVDVDKLARSLWESANPKSNLHVTPFINEVSLSANMNMKEVYERRNKMQWRGSDDGLNADTQDDLASNPLNPSESEIKLMPQDIRSFIIEYDDKMAYRGAGFIL